MSLRLATKSTNERRPTPLAVSLSKGGEEFCWLRHPNYWIVAVEGVALPLVHSAWVTAIVFTALNAILLLRFRIPIENGALRLLETRRLDA